MSAAWTKKYAARTAKLAKAIAETKVPLLCVGMPAVKSSKMNTNMFALNDIYRAATEAADSEFVDLWNGFVD